MKCTKIETICLNTLLICCFIGWLGFGFSIALEAFQPCASEYCLVDINSPLQLKILFLSLVLYFWSFITFVCLTIAHFLKLWEV